MRSLVLILALLQPALVLAKGESEMRAYLLSINRPSATFTVYVVQLKP